jgi:hypothetical protein
VTSRYPHVTRPPQWTPPHTYHGAGVGPGVGLAILVVVALLLWLAASQPEVVDLYARVAAAVAR